MRVERSDRIAERGLCIYCLKENRLEEEHVPPECLFARSARDNLPRFGACRRCNGGWSKVDEFFREVLVDHMLGGVDSPELQEVRASVRASQERRQKRGKAQLVKQTPTLTEFNYEKIKDMVCRITAAMFMIETNAYLEPGWDIAAKWVTPTDVEAERTMLAIATSPRRSWGRGAFKYTYAVHRRDWRITQWIYCFYDAAYFVALTAPPQHVGQMPAYFFRKETESDFEVGPSLLGAVAR